MKIGVGILTVQKRVLSPNYFNLLDETTLFHIHIDKERKGPGYSRNQCIKTLYDADCDYIFIFDDDCYPIKKGWQRYFIDEAEEYDLHAITSAYPGASLTPGRGEIVLTSNSMGCFYLLSRKAVETVGYFDPRYGPYGYEDAGYQHRIRISGVNGTKKHGVTLKSTFDYIRAEDMHGENASKDFDGFANFSFKEKQSLMKDNFPIYAEEVSSDVVYKPYPSS